MEIIIQYLKEEQWALLNKLICVTLTDLHLGGVAGACCCVFSVRSVSSLSSFLAPRGKEMLGGLFGWQALEHSGP